MKTKQKWHYFDCCRQCALCFSDISVLTRVLFFLQRQQNLGHVQLATFRNGKSSSTFIPVGKAQADTEYQQNVHKQTNT